MNFYIVPAMSYQQKQKMQSAQQQKEAKRKAAKHRKKMADDSSIHSAASSVHVPSRRGSDAENPDAASVRSAATSDTKRPQLQPQNSHRSVRSDHDPRRSLLGRIQSELNLSEIGEKVGKNDKSEKPDSISGKGEKGEKGEKKRRSEASSVASFLPGFGGRRPSMASELSGGSTASAQSHSGRFASVSSIHVEEKFPEYEPFTDMSVFNTEAALRKTFLNPQIMLVRYEFFLDYIVEHHVNDPINFASVRERSLGKFLLRRNTGLSNTWLNMGGQAPLNSLNMQEVEDQLSHQLLKCRSILRSALKSQLGDQSGYRKLACEQLIQSNFVNYVRHIYALPECTAAQVRFLSKFQKKDYEIKRAFSSIADALYEMKTDTLDSELSDVSGVSTLASRMELLMQSMRKTAFDFTLLEIYKIQILVKLNNNFLIESRITKRLFNLYNLNLQLARDESLKVLVFNSSFSSHYSWYLAATIPFVRVFEASLLNENVQFSKPHEHCTDGDHPTKSGSVQSHPSPTSQCSLKEDDHELYQMYFSRLALPVWNKFTQLSRKELVGMQRKHAQHINPGKINVKPLNFEYYAHPMSTIRAETFDVIQSRDFTSQIQPKNYGSMLQEFHRLLKKGGFLELPMVIPGSVNFGTFNDTLVKPPGTGASSGGAKNARWQSTFTFDSVKDIVASLGTLFGAENVKFSSVLLSAKNQMNGYLIKHTVMSLHESHSEIDQFHQFAEAARDLEKSDDDEIHFYFYIRAEKA